MKIGMKMFRDFPGSRGAAINAIKSFPAAKKRRGSMAEQGIIVPPLLIISVTDRCNLNCMGCYSRANSVKTTNTEGIANTAGTTNAASNKAGDANNTAGAEDTSDATEARSGPELHPGEMTRPQIDKLLAEVADAGTSIVLLAGGEPLLHKEWLDAAAACKNLLYLVFTNGTLMDESYADFFSKNRNLIPLFSLEGEPAVTDNRRGQTVSDQIEKARQLMSERKIPFGMSITTGAHNFDEVVNTEFLNHSYDKGCRVAVYSEYVPVDVTDDLDVLSESMKQALNDFCIKESERGDMLAIAFPGDEEIYGGCLAAGRGFAHISSKGDLEPCPFAAYSDSNVLTTSYTAALVSPLFRQLREQSHLLREGPGGCALRKQNESI